MTDADLDRIEARLVAASPGPWGISDTGAIISGCIRVAVPLVVFRTSAEMQADATFIAAAPTDIAALLAEVRRLREVFLNDYLADSPATRLAHQAGQEAFRERVALVAEDWLKGGHGGEGTWIGNAIRAMEVEEP